MLQDVGVAVGAADGGAIAFPLIAKYQITGAIGVGDAGSRCDQCLALGGGAGDGAGRGVVYVRYVRCRNRGERFGGAAGIGPSDGDGDDRPDVGLRQGIGAAGGTADVSRQHVGAAATDDSHAALPLVGEG